MMTKASGYTVADPTIQDSISTAAANLKTLLILFGVAGGAALLWSLFGMSKRY